MTFGWRFCKGCRGLVRESGVIEVSITHKKHTSATAVGLYAVISRAIHFKSHTRFKRSLAVRWKVECHTVLRVAVGRNTGLGCKSIYLGIY